MASNGHHDVDELIEDLVQEAKQVGHVILDELLERLPQYSEDTFPAEKLIHQLLEAGVEISMNGEVAVPDIDGDGRLAYIASDDAITLYFREIGTIPLLTREQEVMLAQQIELAKIAKKRLKTEHPPATERAELEQAIQVGNSARDKLITANTRLVISLAKNFVGQGVPLLDLIQEGNIGLMHAVEKFDWRRGYKFSTYATWWIRQALTRAIADQGRTIRLPVHRHEQVRKLRNARRELAKELGRDPTSEELAEELGHSPSDVERLMQHAQYPTSLEKPVTKYGDNLLGEFLESGDPLPADIVEEEALANDIQSLLGALPTREARIIELRYGLRDGTEYTLKEVGERFGLTRERIRQIEQDALHRLRSPRRTRKLRAHLS